MRTSCVKNGLVVGVILLFIGIAFQPAVAVNPISADNEEDCSICPKVSKLQIVRLKSLINRVETLDNKLSVISKHNPEIAEKYQELSDEITTLKEMHKEFKPNKQLNDYPYPIIVCSILAILLITILIPWVLLDKLFYLFDNFYLIQLLLTPLLVIGSIPCAFIIIYGYFWGCWDIDIDWEEIWEILGWRPPWR